MKTIFKHALAITGVAIAAQAMAQVTFYENEDFGGRSFSTARPVDNLARFGFNDRASSVRTIAADARIGDDRYAPPPVADFRRRGNERLYEANVSSVVAVYGPPEQRCWIESEPGPQRRGAGGAMAGALIGGILGHQIGGGSGRSLATVGGALAGAAVGSNIARNSQERPVDVQRCENVQSQATASFWDVTYAFRGQVHHVQLAVPPGPTITVNRAGEPRA